MEVTILGRRWSLIRATPYIPIILFVFSFRKEIVVLYRYLNSRDLQYIVDAYRAFQIFRVSLVIFVVLFFIWLVVISAQSILPIGRIWEIGLTAFYLLLHALGLHGMAAYVRNGKIKAYVDELQRTLPGVVLVDFNSAVAVEKISLRPGLFGLIKKLFRGFTTILGIAPPPVRILGAGLHFTLPDERIHGVSDLEPYPVVPEDRSRMERILGVVDLRTQFRISGNQPHKLSKRLKTAVFAHTRDGIEVQTKIWVLATLGQDPVPNFPLSVTYMGDWQPENLRVVKLKCVSDRTGLCRIESLRDELDLQDRLEIHEQWRSITRWVPYTDPPDAPVTPRFDKRRVFAAIYARARNHNGLDGADEIVPWVDLPLHVAIDHFRELISHYNYDDLFTIDENGKMRIDQVRATLAAIMRGSGLLSFRPMFHRAGTSLTEGGRYRASDLLTISSANAIHLNNSKVLRDRGIRVLASGFGDLVVDERIYKQRLDHWQAAWDQETEIVEAELEWESVRVHTRERILAQREFVRELSRIYQSDANSREILALRVLQALEMAAADPKTRQLLPEDTFATLRTIHDWLLPQDMGSGPVS